MKGILPILEFEHEVLNVTLLGRFRAGSCFVLKEKEGGPLSIAGEVLERPTVSCCDSFLSSCRSDDYSKFLLSANVALRRWTPKHTQS